MINYHSGARAAQDLGCPGRRRLFGRRFRDAGAEDARLPAAQHQVVQGAIHI